ncbi:MAG: pyridoxamine 5'-phosphate oxidase family protein [Actinobacteria bacterium]|nr:pyridoxamine 5'-phosphate oxidase family protein [Actinomycetota bacterium]
MVAGIVIACVLVTQRARIATAGSTPAPPDPPAGAAPSERRVTAGLPGPPEPSAAGELPATDEPPAEVDGPTLGATPRTRVHRHSERARSDREGLYAVLDAGLVAHVGFVVDGAPAVLPMGYARDGDRVLLHGSSRNRMLGALAGGAEVCVAVTLLDGLVLAGSAFTHSMNYRSVVVYGRGQEVTDPGEKARALELFVDFVVPGRSAELRPSNRKELAATLVVALPLEEASVKARAGGPIGPEDPGPWTGVIPLRLVRGDPVPAA